ncbi:hypothetical protein G9A89_019370 [Geosiphon pyriformis]|nr:hypothetical protein G9A89_019370 [Geosiphon pyriformis]
MLIRKFSWEITDSKEKKGSNQENSKQNLILENPEIGTLVNQNPKNQNDRNPNINNQQHLPLQQQQPQPPPQQQLQQQLYPPLVQQQQLIMQMAYVPIAKLKKFIGKEDNAQIWLNNITKAITANNWNDTRVLQAISYFLQDTADS